MYFKVLVIGIIFCCVKNVHTGNHLRFGDPLCKQPRGDICVEIYQCPFFVDLLQRSPKPRPPRVVNIIREKQCGMVGRKIPKVCCTLPKPSTSTTLKPKTTTPMRSIKIIKDPDIDIRTDISSHKNYNLLPHDTCGPIIGDSRITSGTSTFLGEYPWMTLIIYYTDEGLDFRCGGSIINERFVLTAAHCIIDTVVGIRLGEFDISKSEDCEMGICAPPVQDFYIEKYIVHPSYDSKTLANDIALIKLATPANFTTLNVRPICLPLAEASKTNLVGRNAIVSGWGVTEDGSKSTKLLKVSLPVLPNSVCQRIYGRFATITAEQICAGGLKGKDSCGGDSGGPMKQIENLGGESRFVQYGIVSYGPRDCGTEGQPAIYTRVSSYVPWILDNLDKN